MSKIAFSQAREQKIPISALPLRNVLGEEIEIVSFNITKMPSFGEMALIKTSQATYYTFSSVIMRQLDEIVKPLLEQGKTVTAKISKKRNYFILE